MSHGDRWAAFGGDIDKTLDECLPLLTQKGQVIAGSGLRQGAPPADLSRAGSILFGLQYPETPLRWMAIVTDRQNAHGARDGLAVQSAYPFCYEGIVHRLTVEAVEESENGHEAVIRAHGSFGPELSFFDPLYFRNKRAYRIGATYDFVIAALAYNLSVVHPKPIKITDPEQIRKMTETRRKFLGDDWNAGLEPIEIQIAGAAVLLPVEQTALEDYRFQAPVKSVQSFGVEQHPAIACVGTVVRAGDADLDVMIYATNHTLKGRAPKIGDDIGGAFWLQGYLAGTGEADQLDGAPPKAEAPKAGGKLRKLWPWSRG